MIFLNTMKINMKYEDLIGFKFKSSYDIDGDTYWFGEKKKKSALIYWYNNKTGYIKSDKYNIDLVLQYIRKKLGC